MNACFFVVGRTVVVLTLAFAVGCVPSFHNPLDPIANPLLFIFARGKAAGTDAPVLPVSGATLWLRGDRLVQNNATSWTWGDLSGNFNDAQGRVAGPGSVNGQPAAYFSQSSTEVLSTPLISMGPFSIFVAIQLSSTATAQGNIYEFGPDINITDGEYLTSGNSLSIQVSRTSVVTGKAHTSSAWARDDVARIVSHRFDGSHATHGLRTDGVDPGLTDFNTSDPGTTVINRNLYIGNRASDLSQPVKGAIGEIIVYPSAISDADRQTIECYLGGRYGIAVTGC